MGRGEEEANRAFYIGLMLGSVTTFIVITIVQLLMMT